MGLLDSLHFHKRRKSCEIERLAGPVPGDPLQDVVPKSPVSAPLKKPSVPSEMSVGEKRRGSAPPALVFAGSSIIGTGRDTAPFQKINSNASSISTTSMTSQNSVLLFSPNKGNERQGRVGSKDRVGSKEIGKTQVEEDTMSHLRSLRDFFKLRKLALNDLDLMPTIGIGGFGRVRMCRLKDHVINTGPLKGDRRTYAVKMLNKVKAAQKMGGLTNAVNAVKQEVQILVNLEFPFVVNLITMFHDDKRVCILMEFVNGGELFKFIYRNKDANMNLDYMLRIAKHFSSELILTLEELHSKDIMYRDLKPENVLLDCRGHAKLVDFGLAKHLENRSRATTNCGTLVYQAPEILLNKEYGYGVDYWACGVILFELMVRKPPWGVISDPFEISQAIMSLNIKYPWSLDNQAKNLVKKMLVHDETKRWGASMKYPVGAVKTHKFFDSVNWDAVANLKTEPPYKPDVKDDMDSSMAERYPESIEQIGQELGTKDKLLWESNLQEVLRSW